MTIIRRRRHSACSPFDIDLEHDEDPSCAVVAANAYVYDAAKVVATFLARTTEQGCSITVNLPPGAYRIHITLDVMGEQDMKRVSDKTVEYEVVDKAVQIRREAFDAFTNHESLISIACDNNDVSYPFFKFLNEIYSNFLIPKLPSPLPPPAAV